MRAAIYFTPPAGAPLTRAAALWLGRDAFTERVWEWRSQYGGTIVEQFKRLVATLDNLGKGAAGAAVQNFNIMAGFDPVAGLTL